MKVTTQKNLDRAMETARREGFAVIGFAVKPDDGGLMRLDNQKMDKQQFIAMLGEALNVFANYTDDGEAKLIIN
jgi:hypothetical protein